MSVQRVSIIGIGRLGICLALCMERAGYEILGVDLSLDYIRSVNEKTLESSEPKVTEYLQASTKLKATISLQEGLDFSDLIFIIAPTNTVPDIQTYDHTILSLILSEINKCRVSNKHIIISSTVFPGYISKTASQLIADCTNTTLSYNPEFIAQGDIIQGLESPDLVLIGEGSKSAGDRLEMIYKSFCLNTPHISRISIQSAEIAKLAVNCFITGKIAFANLIGEIADETPGADKFEILQAVGKDGRIGLRYLLPGYGFGGPCFPRDNRALGNYASLLGIEPILFRATDESNDQHAAYITKKLLDKNLDHYVFEDVCYKSNCPVPIIENSQKLIVAKSLAEKGKEVTILDSENVITKVRQEYKNIFNYAYKKLSC